MTASLQEDTKISRLARWDHGETPGPWEVIVFPTNRCNQRCKICWQRYVEQKYGKVDYETELSDERLLRLVDEGHELGVREWSIVGGGEPMLRANVVMEMCKRIREYGMNGCLHSNGTRFTRDQLESLVRSGWERITISLDGATAEINDAIRSKDCFARATEALRTINELRRQYGVKTPYTTINCVVTRLNYNTLDAMVELGHETGAGFVGASMLVVQGDLCASFALTPEQWAELPEHIERAKALAERYGIANDFDALIPATTIQNKRVSSPGEMRKSADGSLATAHCFEPWLTLTILAESGRSGPCTVFWEQEVLSLCDHSMKEAWLGSYMQDLRGRMAERRKIPGYCANCCSHLVTRNEEVRHQLAEAWRPALREMGLVGAGRHIGRRLAFLLREGGLKSTARRGYEWVYTRFHRS